MRASLELLDRAVPKPMAWLKAVAYRTPLLRTPLLPRYPYWVDPGTLAEMVRLISDPTTRKGAVVEVGAARGITSAFLLEHLRSTDDYRRLVIIDTFSGFTDKCVRHETEHRDKRKSELADFTYGSPKELARSLDRLGHHGRYRIIAGDCAEVDWPAIGPIAALLLDVDLYLPTRATLNAVWPLLLPNGGIVVDDCVEPHWADGSLEAYTEFIRQHALPFTRVGGKAGGIRKPSANDRAASPSPRSQP